MQKISYCTGYKIKFCISKDAAVKTKPNKTLREFFHQRKRWASKGLYYKNKKIVFKLVLIFLFYAGLIIQAALSLFSPLYLITFLISFFTKLFVEYIILRRGGRLLFNGVNLKYFIPAELIHIPYIIIMSVAGTFGGFKWKDRKVKL